MVIVIIALLAGLLLPAISGAMRAARQAAVQSEEQSLAQALTAFRGQYGQYPPSRILLCEDGNYAPYLSGSTGYMLSAAASPSAVDVSDQVLAQRSLTYLRQFWPRVSVGSKLLAGQPWPDFNGNGKQDPPVLLSGDEALVWFLGGVPVQSQTPTGTVWGPGGLATSPVMPFTQFMSTGSRKPPWYDFDAKRLTDIDGDGYPSYVDSLGTGRPYAYFSAYGNGYDPNDCNWDGNSPLVESDGSGNVAPILLRFQMPWPVTSTSRFEVSPPPNPYTLTTSVATTVQWLNGQSFQLVSAGVDGQYGVGGLYSAGAEEPLPVDAANITPSTDPGIRQRERDNLASFHQGTLE